MSSTFQIVVCGSIVPDPLQTLEPVETPAGPALKNEMLLPAVLDPWAAHALYEAANLASHHPGSKVWLVSLGPKAKLQQVMMTIAQKISFELLAIDGPASGFSDAHSVAEILFGAITALPGLDRSRLLLFGGWESASRGAGVTLQLVGERLGILDQFQGVDQITVLADGSFEVLERIEGGRHQVSVCTRSACSSWMGHWQFAGAAKQSTNWHGQYAHHYARLTESQAFHSFAKRAPVLQCFPSKAAAANPHC